MTVQDVDTMLYRKLKKGTQYEKLIPKYEKVSHNFDNPSDNSNTYDTLKFMEQWSKKYSWQIAKVAPLLKGKTLAETCKNIYEFLYWHFQYKLDGEAQNLYSPSAAWHYRHKGFDCKSYSLLASMILSNLNIDCAFRMVQQSQPFWSHVYVVVPDGKKYHVIDATTHNNQEVNLTKKHDKIMRHYGLANPLQNNSLGCACQGQPMTKTGLSNPVTLQKAVTNFHAYLNQLERNGVSRNVTSRMLQIVKSNIQNGIDPNMSEVYQKAVSMTPGLGLDFVTTATAVTGAVNGEPDSIKYLVAQFLPTSFISSTFGAVFANGLELSCWGASLTPQKASENLKTKHTPHFNSRLSAISSAVTTQDLQNAINLFIKEVYVLTAYYNIYKPKEASWSTCAKKGIKLYADFIAKLKQKADEMINQFTAKGATVSNITVSPLTFWVKIPNKPDYNELWKAPASSTTQAPQLDFTRYVGTTSIAAGTVNNNTPTNSNGTTNTTTPILTFKENTDGTVTATNPITGETKILTKDQAKQLGYTPASKGISSNAILLGGGALAAFMLLRPTTDVTRTTPRTKTKNK